MFYWNEPKFLAKVLKPSPEALTAYQTIANVYRNRFVDLILVAVTGSNGKTSTKEIIGTILKEAFDEVLISEGNVNNQIGVPRTLLQLDDSHKAAVIEMASNSIGEIDILSRCGEANIAVLTNIGLTHLEGLGDIDGVAREKASIFNGLKKDGLSILNDSLVDNELIVSVCPKFISYGLTEKADYRVIYQGGDFHSSSFTVIRPEKRELSIKWTLKGSHMAENAAAAIVIADYLNITDEVIIRALNKIEILPDRMQIDEINGVLWINDSYNANPCSVKSLIDWVVSVDKEINYLVLGDMLELGESGPSLHLDTINYAKEKLPNTTLLTFGKIMSSVTKDDLSFIDIDKLKDFLKEHLKSGDRIAIKGSRKMELERLQI